MVRHLFLFGLLGFALQSVGQSWSKSIDGLGTFSSPRASDITGDGVKDIILGAGRLEFQKSDTAVFALDGRTGKMLWNVEAKDQIFGSAAVMDISGDGINDVIINGRSAELQAINGKTGEILWKFNQKKAAKKTGEKRWYNFYNPQFVNDLTGDGLNDILIANGGDVMKEPYDEDRPPGYLVAIDAGTGEVISYAEMPDGKEIYMSPALVETENGDYKIIFGTGGETVGGNLFLGLLSQVLKGDLSDAVHLSTGETKGFIAPPAWVDVNSDNYPDMVAVAVDGRVMAFNGRTNEQIWEAAVEGTEAYSSVGIGYFTNDRVPDFFVSFARGIWPELHYTRQFMINGSSGEIEYVDSLGFYQTSSPVVADLDNDGWDEVLQGVNFQTNEEGRRVFKNMLVSVDFQEENKVNQLTRSLEGHNVASTPWMGDMDGNGTLEVIFLHSTNKYKTYTFDGFQINKWSTEFKVSGNVRWGSYMGSNYDGVFRNWSKDIIKPVSNNSSDAIRPIGLLE